MRDVYKYFRVEARELLEGLAQGALELERGAAASSLVIPLLRLAHTLKGASRVVKQTAISDRAHAIEDILSPFREYDAAVPGESVRAMLENVDEIQAKLALLDERTQQKGALEEPFDTVRVEMEDVEKLLASVSELGVRIRTLEKEIEAIGETSRMADVAVRRFDLPHGAGGQALRTDGPILQQLAASVERLRRRFTTAGERLSSEFAQTREVANRLRLLPCAALFPGLARAVRDAAVALGKQARFTGSGGDVRLDTDVLAVVREALLHLVRNAAAHGIETEQDRVAAGKPPSGAIEVEIARRGDRAAFICRDDGAGINLDAVRRVAVQTGKISPAGGSTLGLREALDLLVHGGLSTSESLTGISGRGIGLDIVRNAAERLKGEVRIETKAGHGTEVEICVPVSLAAVAVVTARCGDTMVRVPLEGVRRTMRVDSAEMGHFDGRESIAYEGNMIPFVPLASVLVDGAAVAPRARWSAVVVGAGPRAPASQAIALGVDEFTGIGTVLVSSLPPHVSARKAVAGASLDRDGNPVLVLDPAGVVQTASEFHAPFEPHRREREPILVIDDSLTTRMVEQSILESAGYEVELAVSGEEALEKACARRHSLFLVDIEMPRMDGFEFIARARMEPLLRETPCVLVTSRSQAEDRRRAQQAGVKAYIVKSEFNQRSFLETIQQLVR